MPSRRWGSPGQAAGALLVLGLACAGGATAATLHGRLVARDTGRPVEGAAVRLLETGRLERTGPDGGFSFAALAPGRHTLSTHHLAYADEERAVTVAAAGADSVIVSLDSAVHPAAEVLVRSTRGSSLHDGPWAAGLLTREPLTGISAVTPPERAATLPGVALVRDGTWQTGVSIRGLSRSNIVALVDHTRLETATDLAGALSLVNDAELERIEVVKTPGSVLFGSGCLGGAVHMVTRRAPFRASPEWTGEWNERVSSADRGAAHRLAAERSAGRTALRLNAGYRAADDTRTPQGEIPNSQYEDWSLGGSLGVRTVGEQSLFASWQQVQAEDTGIPGGTPIASGATATYRLARRELAALEYALPNLAGALPLVTLRVSRQEIDRNVEILQSPTVTVTPHATHVTTSFQLESHLLPASRHRLVVGAEAWRRALDSRRERWLKAEGRLVGERPVPRSSYRSAGLYAQDDFDAFGERARFVVGVRHDWSRSRHERTWSPEYVLVHGVRQDPTPGQVELWPGGESRDAAWDASAGVHVRLSSACAMRLLVASAFRSPSLEERFQFLDLGGSLHVGNPGLRPERSVTTNLGGRIEAGSTALDADVFLNSLTDLVTEAAGQFNARSAWVKANIGKARLYGFEAALEQRLPAGVALAASIAFVRGEDAFHHTELAQVAPLSGRLELAAGPGGGATLRVTLVAAAAQHRPGPDEAPTPGWTRWNANCSSGPVRVWRAPVRVRAGVDNVFDRAYREHLSTLRGLVKLEPGRSFHLSLGAGFR